MEYIILFGYIVVFISLILCGRFFKSTQLSKKVLIGLFVIKLLFVGFYFSYYQDNNRFSDSKRFFKQAQTLHNTCFDKPKLFLNILTNISLGRDTQPAGVFGAIPIESLPYTLDYTHESRFVVHLTALLMFFTGQNYLVLLLTTAFLSFCGSVFLYKYFNPQNKTSQKLALTACFIIPSTTFWTSGLSKEVLFFFFISATLFLINKCLYQKWTLSSVLLICLSIGGMIYSKLHLLSIFLPLCVIYVFCHYKPKKLILKYICGIFIFLFFSIIIHYVSYESFFDIWNAIQYQNNHFIGMEQASHADGQTDIYLPFLDGNPLGFLNAIPIALFNAIYYPSLQTTDIYHFCAGMETLLFIGLLINMVIGMFKRSMDNQSLFLLFFCLLSFIVIGLCTPNVGALCRYKSMCLPFLFYLSFFIGQNHIVTQSQEQPS